MLNLPQLMVPILQLIYSIPSSCTKFIVPFKEFPRVFTDNHSVIAKDICYFFKMAGACKLDLEF